MGAANGNLGGIAVIEEVTYGTTPGTPTWIWQHPMPSTLGLRRQMISPSLLSFAGHTARGYAGKYVDGDLTVGLELDDAIIGDILGLAGTYSTDHYILAGGDAADINSISVLMSYGGGGGTPANNFEFIHKGVKANAIRFDINPDTNSSVTLVGIGKDTSKTTGGSAETPSAPAETGVFMPEDLGTVSALGSTLCLYSATIEALVPKTGFERRCMGGTIKEPIAAGRPDVTFTLNLDLDDDSTNDTETLLGAWISGAPIGDIDLGTDFILKDCVATGDFPALQEGQIDYAFSGTASSVEVYC